MIPERVYIDNSLLVRWFLWKFNPHKYPREPQVIRFLASLERVEKYISLISVAELVHTLRYGDDFSGYRLTLRRIEELIQELQGVLGFVLIEQEKVQDTDVGGIIITRDVVRFIDKHKELADCLHVDIAKRNQLCFVTYEKKIGVLKELYDNIMTENKLMKQFG